MDSDAGGRMKVAKLKKTNFHARKHKNQFLLAWKHLGEHIEEEPAAPDATEFSAWPRGNKKATACVALALSDTLFENACKASTAKEVWTSTGNVFVRLTLLKKHVCQSQVLYRHYARWRANFSVCQSYSPAWRRLTQKYEIEVYDNNMPMALVNGLSDHFYGLVSALDAL